MILVTCVALTASSLIAPDAQLPSSQDQIKALTGEIPGIQVHVEGSSIDRLYGTTLAVGASPAASAQAFFDRHGHHLGLSGSDLQVVEWEPGVEDLPLKYDESTGEWGMTARRYTQHLDGTEVFGSDLRVVVRNEHNFPLVLLACDLRVVSTAKLASTAPSWSTQTISSVAEDLLGYGAVITKTPRRVLWAGIESPEPARYAIAFDAEVGTPDDGEAYLKYGFVIDADTHEVLHLEDRIHHVDLIGTVGGLATNGEGADECHEETHRGLPYVQVWISGGSGGDVFSDVDGNFLIEDVGPDLVTVVSQVRGEWFRVFNSGGDDAMIIIEADPAKPISVIHNEANDDETQRSEVNAYVEANRIRDWVLNINPAFPVIGSQESFRINVNIGDNCNAYYNGSSINFYTSGGGCNNTAFATVVHHEYGHHLVNVAGSGQGEYGEGMGDVVGALLSGEPELAKGFFAGDCENGLRNADNTCQYQESGCSSCGSEIHACGQLISGCAWDLRQGMIAFDPVHGEAITNQLIIDSIPLHNGSAINEAIVIDILTLDDDDDVLGNGTPHYDQIAWAFSAHGIPAPPLDLLEITLVDGVPTHVHPEDGVLLKVDVADVHGTHDPGTTILRVDSGDGPNDIEMTDLGEGHYEAILPGAECGTDILFSITAQTTDGQVASLPAAGAYSVVSAFSEPDLAIDDHFETDQGWVVSGDSPSPWERGFPQQAGGSWIPHDDFDGGGQAYLTDNQGGGGAHDLDGTTILVSPVIDASGGGTLTWAYWLSERTNNPHTVEDGLLIEVATNDAGDNWVQIRLYETYQNGWRTDAQDVVAGGLIEPSSTIQIRVTAMDEGDDGRLEAGLDAVELLAIDCDPGDDCPADFDGSGRVDVADLLHLIAAWGSEAGDIDGDGTTNVADLLALLEAYGECS
jgi:hypothetical protein